MHLPFARILMRGGALLLLALPVCHADVPDAREACEHRNSALCETNGVTFMQVGPCPAIAKTLRPPGHEDCSRALQAQPKATRAEPAHPSAKAPHTDLAYIGQIERWLIPLMVIGGGLLLGALAIYLLLRKRRQQGQPVARRGHPAIVFFAAGSIGLVAAYHAAGAVFAHVDGGFNNHDSAGPVLIAGGAALLAFVLVLNLVFALSALTLNAVLRRRPD
jgi:hypothetical protein